MNARVVGILVVLLVVLGGGALLYQHQERVRRPDNVGTLGKGLFKEWLHTRPVARVTTRHDTSTGAEPDHCHGVCNFERGLAAAPARDVSHAPRPAPPSTGQTAPVPPQIPTAGEVGKS